MLFTITDLLNQLLSLGTGVAASKIMEKLNQDLVQIISRLILKQYHRFQKQFKEAADTLSNKELVPAIQLHFGQLTAAQLSQPLSEEILVDFFMKFFLNPKFRKGEKIETIDPKYRTLLYDCAQEFIRQFETETKQAFDRNSAAATRLFVNSLDKSLKNEQKILEILQQIQKSGIDFPLALQKEIQLPLQQTIKAQIQAEFTRFRDEWPFILRTLRGQTTAEEEAEKEWLAILKQVLEWKRFQNIRRIGMKNSCGELFEMQKPNEIGVITRWVCWGCPNEKRLTDEEVKLAVMALKEHSAAIYFVISRHPLPGNQIQILERNGISWTLTLDAFVNTLLNIDEHREIVIAGYEAQDIYHNYINLNCHTREKPDAAFVLQTYFQDWIQSEKITHLALLGDFGTGKTEFCRRMQWHLLKNYQSAQPARIPILITLRDQKGLKLPQMIANIMNEMGLKEIDYPAFRTLNRLGRFVILIDGFDEMDTHASPAEMKRNFQTLYVLAEGQAKVLLTSRTHYFEHLARKMEIISKDFQTVYLNLLTRDQVREYATKICESSEKARNMFAELEKLPQVDELMRTPVLLDMIIKIFPDLREYEPKIDLAVIYQRATERWIKQAEKEGRLDKLKPEEVIPFMQELAWQMHQEDRLQIKYTQLRNQTYDTYRKRLQIPDTFEIDAIFSEVRTCTFLNRDDDGNYKFAHKSFMEYFTAVYLASLLRKNEAPETAINEEIRQFMHQLLVKKVKNYRTTEFQFNGDLPEGMYRKEGDPFAFIHEKDNSEMVWIPPGQFIVGGEMRDREKPIRIIRLAKGAFLDKFLVTNQQYARFLNETGRFENKWINLQGSYKNERCRIQQQKGKFTVEPGYEQHPVNFVSYYEAEAYADWAGKQLPSEWLWEKAGRGIDGRTYPWGDEWNWDKCNSGEHWAKRDLTSGRSAWHDSKERLKAHITEVGKFSQFSSPFGCTDLSGNLWEWMIEFWDKRKDTRVVRGGCFFFSHDRVRLPYRLYGDPTDRGTNLGFRLSRTN